MKNAPYIEELVIHPVKGLRGISVAQARVTPFGLAGDRRYMLVDADGRFMTQRRFPALARFEVGLIESDPEISVQRLGGASGLSVRISYERAGSIVLPLEPESSSAELRPVTIWEDTVHAASVSPQADAFFSEVLGEKTELVWMPEESDRFADTAYAPKGERVSFADGYPILVLGKTSVDELNTRLDIPVPTNRFRANVLVGGTTPWQEDAWTSIEATEVRLNLVKPCARCVVITTDQETGERTNEPTATLATYRIRDGKVMVGMNALAGPNGAHLHVGEALQIK